MGNRRGWHWKRRFSGLAFRISFMVFAATLFTSLVITWVSIHSIGTFLRGELDRKLPELLEHTSTRLDLWYEQREHDVTAFARSQILLEGLSTRDDATREEVSWYLSYRPGAVPPVLDPAPAGRRGRAAAAGRRGTGAGSVPPRLPGWHQTGPA